MTFNAPGKGWLILSDTAYPGWKAKVNGRGATIRKVDGIFRAVFLEKGDDRIEFNYSPYYRSVIWLPFILIIAISLLTAVLALSGKLKTS